MALAGPALAATGTTSAAATQTISAASSIKWGPCSDPDLAKAHAQCGDLQVPLDYDQPDSQQISLAVSRVVHTSPAADYQGVMLVNPGGPGGSGLGLSVLGQFVPNHAGDAYDWIGFDPRGVGSSKPSLSCLPHYFGYNRPYYVPETQELERTWLARSDAYAKACGANGRALLPHMKTTDAAKDMDSIRTALGAQQVNYYGFSYGTYLGQVYSTLFPSRVRRMVLDSNVDPRRVWYAANLDQDVAFDRNINIWLGWLAKYDKVYHLGTTEVAVRKLFYAEEQRLRKQPAGGLIGADEWVDTFLQAGYYQLTWLGLADVFSAWINKHDVQALKDAYDSAAGPGDDNGFAVYNAVQCTDVQWPTSWSRWRRDNDRVYRKAPFETWANAWYNAPCLYWQAKAGRPRPAGRPGWTAATSPARC